MKVVKVLWFLCLLLIGLVGLAMTVCGGGVILLSLQNLPAATPAFIWVVALVSLLIGIVIVRFVWKDIASIDDFVRIDDKSEH